MYNQSLKKVWNGYVSYATKFYKPKFNQKKIKESTDVIVNWLKRLNRGFLLDTGCGRGQYVIYANVLGFKSVGVDISSRSIKIAMKNCKKYGGKVLIADVRNLPFKEGIFDVVISGGVVEHFKESQQALCEAYRVLKENGVLLINVPHRMSVYILNKKLQQILGVWRVGYERFFTISTFQKMLHKCGFKIKEIKRTQIQAGRRHPLIGKILNLLDKPLFLLGYGGPHICFYCIK
jgi:ubiquinone/menaquinone biosynthesis C-methylase UbiE